VAGVVEQGPPQPGREAQPRWQGRVVEQGVEQVQALEHGQVGGRDPDLAGDGGGAVHHRAALA
jgi:hypothetical protein